VKTRTAARAAIAAATVAMALFAAPASATAATSCDFIPTSRLLNVEVSAVADGAVLRVAPGGDIVGRATAGANGTPFSGRIATAPLRPGSYRALLSAVDGAGNRSHRAKATFTVLGQ
jgi:hypothetical protein